MTRTQIVAAAVAGILSLHGVAGTSAAKASDVIGALEYTQHNLVSDQAGVATTTDPNLVDPWGVAFQPTGAFWVGNQNTGVATLYDGLGVKTNSTFVIPAGATGGKGQPTGMVANPTRAFNVPGTALSAFFIFATLDGTISAWAPNLPVNPTNAVLAVDNSAAHAAYTGLEFGITAKGGFLYAANFRSGAVDVFDKNFKPANAQLSGTFKDPDIPADFAPFNIRNIDGNLYVSYAKQNAAKTFIEFGQGKGFVDEFDTDGNLISRIASGGQLNAPWGMAKAPDGFGLLSGSILVGNFGDGHIFGFSENILDQGPALSFVPMLGADGTPLTIPGLWSLGFGGGTNSSPDTLFFSAGPQLGQHGLFGSLTPASASH
jgi:uncharacterized protein (TIGR03118 family)